MSHEMILSKIEEVAGSTKAAIEKSTELEKKYDGLVNQQFKEIADVSAKSLEELQSLQDEVKSEKKRNDKLEAMLANPGAGTKAVENAASKKWQSEINDYIRRREPVSGDTVDEMSKYLSSNINGKEDAGFVNSIKADNNPQTGYLLLGDALTQKALQVGIDPDGGYLVNPERLDARITRIFETSPMRAISNVITTTSDSVEMIIDDNEAASGGWVGETASRPETGTPQIGVKKIFIHEQFAKPKATQKFLDDASINVEQWLTGKINDKLTRFENTAFVVGDGAEKPKGFLSYPAWSAPGTYQRDALEQVNSGSAGNFTYDGVVALYNSLIEDYRVNSNFLIKRNSWTDILQLKDANGRPLIEYDMLKTSTSDIMLGRPVRFANDMPAVAADALALAYGDFSKGYTIVDRLGLRVLRDPYTDKPYVEFYATKRVGGDVTNFEAIKIQKLAA